MPNEDQKLLAEAKVHIKGEMDGALNGNPLDVDREGDALSTCADAGSLIATARGGKS